MAYSGYFSSDMPYFDDFHDDDQPVEFPTNYNMDDFEHDIFNTENDDGRGNLAYNTFHTPEHGNGIAPDALHTQLEASGAARSDPDDQIDGSNNMTVDQVGQVADTNDDEDAKLEHGATHSSDHDYDEDDIGADADAVVDDDDDDEDEDYKPASSPKKSAKKSNQNVDWAEEEDDEDEHDAPQSSGKIRKPYTQPRKLIRWNTSKDQLLLLALEYECKMQKIALPWEAAAKHFLESASREAPTQHLAKVRDARVYYGLEVPPPLPNSHKQEKAVTAKEKRIFLSLIQGKQINVTRDAGLLEPKFTIEPRDPDDDDAHVVPKKRGRPPKKKNPKTLTQLDESEDGDDDDDGTDENDNIASKKVNATPFKIKKEPVENFKSANSKSASKFSPAKPQGVTKTKPTASQNKKKRTNRAAELSDAIVAAGPDKEEMNDLAESPSKKILNKKETRDSSKSITKKTSNKKQEPLDAKPSTKKPVTKKKAQNLDGSPSKEEPGKKQSNAAAMNQPELQDHSMTNANGPTFMPAHNPMAALALNGFHRDGIQTVNWPHPNSLNLGCVPSGANVQLKPDGTPYPYMGAPFQNNFVNSAHRQVAAPSAESYPGVDNAPPMPASDHANTTPSAFYQTSSQTLSPEQARTEGWNDQNNSQPPYTSHQEGGAWNGQPPAQGAYTTPYYSFDEPAEQGNAGIHTVNQNQFNSYGRGIHRQVQMPDTHLHENATQLNYVPVAGPIGGPFTFQGSMQEMIDDDDDDDDPETADDFQRNWNACFDSYNAASQTHRYNR